MSIGYKVNVNDTFHFDMDQESVSQLDSVSVGLNQFHILDENAPFKASIIETDFNQKKYTVVVNGNSYSVAISNSLDILIKEMGFEIGASKQVNTIKAPMPGLILEVSVKEGQEVQENDPLLILEAMKMESTVTATISGKIRRVVLAPNTMVDQNDLVIEFE